MAKYELLRMGALYIDGIPQMLGSGNRGAAQYPGHGKIDIGDSAPGCTINWVKPNGWDAMIANRNVLFDVSWDNLNSQKNSFAKWQEVHIDGWVCICKMVHFLGRYGWLDALHETGGADSIWHWESVGSLDANSWKEDTGQYCFRMSNSNPHNFTKTSVAAKFDYLSGFRLMLERRYPEYFMSKKTIVLDGQLFGVRHENMKRTRTGGLAFKPVMYPLEKPVGNIFRVNYKLFKDTVDVRAYTLLMDGKPVNQHTAQPPKYKAGAQLELTDRYYGDKYLIPWIFKYGCAFAAKDVLKDISLEELLRQGFV